MSSTSRIEWTDATWNPITGCTPCSPGCDHCYAAAMVRRFPALHDNGSDPLDTGNFPLPFRRIQFHPERLDIPLHWRKPRRIFVNSMSDTFHPDVPYAWKSNILAVIALCQQHTFLLLTKRPENVLNYLRSVMPPYRTDRNAWLGVTVCNQAEADAKIPILLKTPAALRFVSIEPMLGTIHLKPWWLNGIRPVQYDDHRPHWVGGMPKLDWVICGGETGPGARPMNPFAACDLRNQCIAAGVPFFWKGCGTAWLRKSDPAYHLLEGREYHQFPEASTR